MPELSRNSEHVCPSIPPVSDWSTCVGSADAFNSSDRAFDNERDQCCQKGSRSRCSLARKKTGCPELVRHGFTSEGLAVLVDDLRFKSGNRIEFLHLCSSETCQCAKHCALEFGDFGVFHGVHQCVLGASRDQRGILQHLLSATRRYSRGVRNTGSDLLDC